MFVKFLWRFLLVTSCYLAVAALTLTSMVTAVNTTHDHSNLPASSSSKTLPPFGPDILKGYQSCNAFKSDLVKYLSSSGENYIQNQKNISSCYYNDTNTYYNSSVDTPYFQRTRRTQKKETSYGTNNQVGNVQDKELIRSDGKYLYAATGDRILVSDLNGKVVVNVTVPSPPLTFLDMDSIFINKNILTAFATLTFCDLNCNSSYSAFYYNFNLKTKTMTLVKQYDISSFPGSVDTRQIGDFTYLLTNAYYGDLYWALDRCTDNFKDLSADEYEAEALAYLNNNVDQYASKIVAKISEEGATSTCNNIIKLFNELIQQYEVSLTTTKVLSIGLSGMSKKPYFFPFTYQNSHISENSILVAAEGNVGDTLLMKFSLKDLVITPTSVGSFDGSMISSRGIDLYKTYYRIASTSFSTGKAQAQVTVLKEQNSQLKVVGQVTVETGGLFAACFHKERGYLATTKWSEVYYNESTTNMILLNLTSPTNPSISASEVINSPLYNMYPIRDGNYIISIDNVVSQANASGIAVYLFQATKKHLKQVGKPSEVIITDKVYQNSPLVVYSEAIWDFHAFRYLSQSRKLIIPLNVCGFGYYNDTDTNDYFQGFYVYEVDPVTGVKPLGNVTHDVAERCNSNLARSMVFNGDLITFMGNSIKCTSSVTTLSNLKWEIFGLF